MVDLLEDLALGPCVSYLLLLLDLALLEDLHCVEATIGLFLDEEHLAVGASANDLDHVEIVLGDLACPLLALRDNGLIALLFFFLVVNLYRFYLKLTTFR